MLGGLAGATSSHLFFGRGTYCLGLKGDTVIGGWELFSWELIMTFVLILAVYAAIIPPGHGDMGPSAIGLTITGLMWAGKSPHQSLAIPNSFHWLLNNMLYFHLWRGSQICQ